MVQTLGPEQEQPILGLVEPHHKLIEGQTIPEQLERTMLEQSRMTVAVLEPSILEELGLELEQPIPERLELLEQPIPERLELLEQRYKMAEVLELAILEGLELELEQTMLEQLEQLEQLHKMVEELGS